jgi:hypothetical protein
MLARMQEMNGNDEDYGEEDDDLPEMDEEQ